MSIHQPDMKPFLTTTDKSTLEPLVTPTERSWQRKKGKKLQKNKIKGVQKQDTVAKEKARTGNVIKTRKNLRGRQRNEL